MLFRSIVMSLSVAAMKSQTIRGPVTKSDAAASVPIRFAALEPDYFVSVVAARASGRLRDRVTRVAVKDKTVSGLPSSLRRPQNRAIPSG